MMARKVKRRSGPPPEQSKYYGPAYNSRADDRSPDRTQHDDYGAPKAHGGPPKGGKTKTVMRDPWDYYRANKNKRPKRS